MTTTTAIAINKSGRVPMFKELIGLEPDTKNTSELLDLCVLLHPNSAKQAQGEKCSVYTKGKHYIYTLYKTHIIRMDVEANKRRIYDRIGF